MANARAVIDIDINTSPAAAALRSLQSQINGFSSALNKANTEQGLAAKGMARQLSDLVNSSKFFTAETVRMQTSAAQLDNTLKKGQVSMGQFFSAKFRKDGLAAAQVMSLANARASALQTQFVQVGAAAGGMREALAIRPLQAFNTAATVSAQRLAIHRAMLQQATTSMINFGKNTQWAGRQLMVGFTVPLTIFGGLAAKTFRELEAEAINFKKVYGDIFTTDEETQAAMQNVQDLASEFTKYGIAVKDTMALAGVAAQSGLRNAELMAATTQATRLATLGQMEQADAMKTIISLQTAFKASNEELAESVDFLNIIENQTVLSLQDVAGAIPRVAPVIQGLGGDVKDLAVLLVAMKEGGVSAGEGANALKSSLGRLITPTKRAKEMAAGFGINLERIVQENRGQVVPMIQELAQAMSSLGGLEQQQLLSTLFGKFQYARIGALFKSLTDDSSQAARAMGLINMEASQLAEIADKELSVVEEATGTKMVAAMERLKVSIAPIGEMFLKMATPIINFLASIAEKFNNLPDFAKRFIGLATVITGLVIPAGTMFLGLLMNLIGTLIKFGHIVGIAFKGFMSGGFKGAFDNVSQALKYMSLQEIDAANAAQQLAGTTQAVNAALLDQVGNAEASTAAIMGLAGAYDILVQNMRESMLVGGLPMAAPGQAGLRAGRSGLLYKPLPIVARNKGGSIPYMSAGNTVPGTGNTDTVPAMLTPGEFVVNKKATEQNLETLQAINNGDVQYRNKGGGIAKPGRKFYGPRPNPYAIAAQQARERLAQFESSRSAIAGVYGLPISGPSRSTASRTVARQTSSLRRSKEIFETVSQMDVKDARLLKAAKDLGISEEELRLKAIGNLTLEMSPSANMRMANGNLSRQSLLSELSHSAVYSPLDDQLRRYFGKSLDKSLFDQLYRQQIEMLPENGITNALFEKATRNALRQYLDQNNFTKAQRNSFLRDILTPDSVRANVSKDRIRQALRSRGLDFTEDGDNIIAEYNGEIFNFGNLAGRTLKTHLGRPERISRYDKFPVTKGFERVHANKGGMIPGVQYARIGRLILGMGRRTEAPKYFAKTIATPYGEKYKSQAEKILSGLFGESEWSKMKNTSIGRSMLKADVSHKVERKTDLGQKIWWEKELFGAFGAENRGFEYLFGFGRTNTRKIISDANIGMLSSSERRTLKRFMSGVHPTSKSEIKTFVKIISNLKAYSKMNSELPEVQRLINSPAYTTWMPAAEALLKARLRKRNNLGGTRTMPIKSLPRIDVESRNKGGIIPGVQYRNDGGEIFESAKKTIVPGVGNTDTVPAALTPGEFVVNKQATQQNKPLLQAINSGKPIEMNMGGQVPGIQYLRVGGQAQVMKNLNTMFGRFRPSERVVTPTETRWAIMRQNDEWLEKVLLRSYDNPDFTFMAGNFEKGMRPGILRTPENTRNLFGPGIYTTKNEERASTYMKDAGRGLPDDVDKTGLNTARIVYKVPLDDATLSRSFLNIDDRYDTASNAKLAIIEKEFIKNIKERFGLDAEKIIKKRLSQKEKLFDPSLGAAGAAGSPLSLSTKSIGIVRNNVLDEIEDALVPQRAYRKLLKQVDKAEKQFDKKHHNKDGEFIDSPEAQKDLARLRELQKQEENFGWEKRYDIEMAWVDAVKAADLKGLTHMGGLRAGKKEGITHRVVIFYDNPNAIAVANKGGIIPNIQNFNKGNFISPTLKLNNGNIVPGVGSTDTVPAMLTPGEFVVNQKAAQDNLPLLHAINGGQVQFLNPGGVVGDIQRIDGKYYVDDGNSGTKGPYQTRGEARRVARGLVKAARPAKQPGMMRGMGASMGLGMGGMGVMMLGQQMQASAAQKGQSSAAGGMIANAGILLSMASILPFLKAGIAIPLAAIAAAIGGTVLALKAFREETDRNVRKAAEFGSNLGGAANRMEEVSAATGYQFARDRSPLESFKFTQQEIEGASQFGEYFESETGQKFVEDLQKLDPQARYEEVRSAIAMAIADGMDKETAKAYGDAVAFYTNDALLKARIGRDIRSGEFVKGSTAAIAEIDKRVSSAQERLPELVEAGGMSRSYLSDILGTEGMTNIVGESALTTIPFLRGIHESIDDMVDEQGNFNFSISAIANNMNPVAMFRTAAETFLPGQGGEGNVVSNLKDLGKNAESVAAQFGSSIQILKELENAEALLMEERKNGIISTQQYEDRLSKLQNLEEQQYQRVSDAVKIASDQDFTKQAVGNQLVLAGFEGDLAKTIADVTSANAVAQKMYNENFQQLSEEQQNVVTSVISRTLTGITPENAQAKIAEIENTYMLISEQLLNAAKNGLTPQELDTAVLTQQISNFVQSAFTDVDMGRSEAATRRRLATENLVGVDTLGLRMEDVTGALGSFIDRDFALRIASSKQELQEFVPLLKELQQFPGINVEIITETESGRDPQDVAKDIRDTLEDISKLKFKGIRKEIVEALPAAEEYISLARQAGISFDNIPGALKEAATQADALSKALDPKRTGILKQVKVGIITELFGNEYGDPAALTSAINAVFPDGVDPLYIPLILQLQNPEVLQLISGGYGTQVLNALKQGKTSIELGMGKTPDQLAREGGGTVFDLAPVDMTKTPPFTGEKPTGPSGGGGGQKSLLEQLQEQFKSLRDIYKSMKQFINSETGAFKKIAAGPFGPEFIEFLKSQGEEGLKILNGSLDKMKKAYKEFRKIQMQEAANFAQTLPANLIRQRQNLNIESGFRGRLERAGFNEEQQDVFIEGIGGPEAIRQYNKLTKMKKENKDLSKSELNFIKEINRAIKLGGPEAEKLFRSMSKKEAQDNLKEMNQELSDLTRIMSLGYTKEEADQIAALGDVSALTDQQIRNLGEGIKQYNLALLASDPEALAQQLRNVAMEINDIQRQIDEINVIQPLQDQLEEQQKIIEANERSIELKEREISQIGRSIELKQREIEPIDDAIEKLEEQKTKVEESYETQFKALDDIAEKEENLARIREGRLDVANALSRGDVAGAAQAAIEMRRRFAEQQQESVRNALEKQRQQEIDAIDAQINEKREERKTIEEEIEKLQLDQRVIQDEIYQIQQDMIPVQDEIYRLNQLIVSEADRLDEQYNNAANELLNLQAQLREAISLQEKLRAAAGGGGGGGGGGATQGGGGTTPASVPGVTTPGTLQQANIAAGKAVTVADRKAQEWYASGGASDSDVQRVVNQAAQGDTANFEARDWAIIANNIGRPATVMYGGKILKRMFGGSVNYRGSREAPPGMMMGGKVNKFAFGSMVPGRGMTDKVPALLTPGEFVVRKSVAREMMPALQLMNSQVFPNIDSYRFNVPYGDGGASTALVMGQTTLQASNNTSLGPNNVQYNYNLSVSAETNANPEEIANQVIYQIKRFDDRRIRGTQIG